MPLSTYHQRILDNAEKLPGNAKIPLPVAELIAGVCRRTIKRNPAKYPLVQISPNRKGVELRYLRNQQPVTA